MHKSFHCVPNLGHAKVLDIRASNCSQKLHLI